MVSPQSGRTTFAYDLAGRESVKRLANGARVTQVYDASGRVRGMITADAAVGLVRRLTYTFDAAGRRLVQLASDGSRTSWTYDAAGQLGRELRTGANAIAVTHAYDPAGNRTLQIDVGTRTTFAFDAGNQLTVQRTGAARTTYQYDASGNRTQQDAPAETTYYAWDAHNRMVSAEPMAGKVTFAYDGTGRRVLKESPSNSVRFVWDYEKVLQEADGSGTTDQQYLATDQQFGDLVSAYGKGSSKYYGFDALGSTELLLDGTGSVADRYAYRAYGLAAQTSGTDANPYSWIGKQGYRIDNETGLYLMGAGNEGRFYDPQTAQFLSKDPLEYDGRDPNLYLYCSNDPINNFGSSRNPVGDFLQFRQMAGQDF